MCSPPTGQPLAQTSDNAESQETMTKTNTSKKSMTPKDRDEPADKSSCAGNMTGEEAVTTDNKNRREGLEKRGRLQEKDEGHNEEVTGPLPIPLRRLGRSRSAGPKKIRAVSTHGGRRRYSEGMIGATLEQRPEPVTIIVASEKEIWIELRLKAASLFGNFGRTAGIVYDGVSTILRLFVSYILKYLVMVLTLALLVSFAHRAICGFPLVRYFHSQCTSVWAPVPVFTDPKQEPVLSRLEEPMRRESEVLNQLQASEYFELLPLALAESSQSMRKLGIMFNYSSLEPESREATAKLIRVYSEKAAETGDNLSGLKSAIPHTVSQVLWEREFLMKRFEKSHSRADDDSALTSFLEMPGLLWSFVATPLLGRRVLTPYQARQVEEEQVRIRQLRRFLPWLDILLGKLAQKIATAQENFKDLDSRLEDIEDRLALDMQKVSRSRDLLSRAENHPLHRLESFLGLRQKEAANLRSRHNQVALLQMTNGTVTITLRELNVMVLVVKNLQNDMRTITDTLWDYQRQVDVGEISSEDRLLEAVKAGMETLAQGRVNYLEREKKRHEERSKEFRESMAARLRELRDVVDEDE